MFPLAKIPNTVIQPKPFFRKSDVIFRNDINLNDWRNAIEGTEYTINTARTDLGSFALTKYFTLRAPQQLGKKLFLRYKFISGFTSCILNPWGTAELFKLNVTPNVWHTLEVRYGATASSTHIWIVDGVQRYSGTNLSPAYFTFSYPSAVLNSVEFDVGTKGGTLPQGCEWWYTY